MDSASRNGDLSRRGVLKGAVALGLRSAVGLPTLWSQAALRAGLAAIPLGGMLTQCLAQDASAQQVSVPFRVANPNTGEKFSVDLFVGGDWNMRSVLVCHHLFRDWRENSVVEMDRKLYAALYVLQRYFAPDQYVQINSGYRTEQTNALLRKMGYRAAPESFHLKARATDFTIVGAQPIEVARVAQLFRLGGMGIYQKGFHHRHSNGWLHIDTGPVGRIWFG